MMASGVVGGCEGLGGNRSRLWYPIKGADEYHTSEINEGIKHTHSFRADRPRRPKKSTCDCSQYLMKRSDKIRDRTENS